MDIDYDNQQNEMGVFSGRIIYNVWISKIHSIQYTLECKESSRKVYSHEPDRNGTFAMKATRSY